MSRLEGEAESSLVNASISQDRDQMLRMLGVFYGDIRSIMGRSISAHKCIGKIPSQNATQKHRLHLVGEHCRVINGVRDLESEVTKEVSWERRSEHWLITNNHYYLHVLGQLLPD